MAIDGFEWDAPDRKENAAAFGYPGKGAEGEDRPAFPKVRVVTVSECGSHAVVDAEIGGVAGRDSGEQSLAPKPYRRLAEDWLLIADRNFYHWQDMRAAVTLARLYPAARSEASGGLRLDMARSAAENRRGLHSRRRADPLLDMLAPARATASLRASGCPDAESGLGAGRRPEEYRFRRL